METTELLVSEDQALQVANDFRQAIQIGVLMALGAHNLRASQGTTGYGALTFDAIILPFNEDGTRADLAEVMTVDVAHTWDDLIDVTVIRPDGSEHYKGESLYIDQINKTLFALDWNGKETLNPRIV
mgnify:FL=1